MDVELLEIRDFLAGHPPFDHLPGECLERLPKELAVRYLRRGSVFPPEDADGAYLYILRKGAVEVRDRHDELLAKYAEGDIYATPCVEDRREHSALAVEDSLFYLLPCERLAQMREQHEEFNQHFSRSLRERLRFAVQGLRETVSARTGLLGIDVGDLLARPPVTVVPETSIRDAARVMTDERVSALLVTEGTRLVGIVTDRDLRSRCIAAGRSPELPVTEIMTRRLHKVSRDTPAFEALMTMTRLHVHHLPVLAGAEVAGVVSSTDLIRYQSANAVYLVMEMRRCDSVAALMDASAELPELQVQLVGSGATANHVGQAISAVTDALTTRLLQLAERELGPAPVPYCWISVGSQARHEQTSHSDQDSALILSDEYRREHYTYFESLARFVTDGLNECGFVYCPGGVMASNPQWRQPLASWEQIFSGWINRPERKSLMLASNFFDIRVVHGDESLYDRLRAHALQQTRENRIFIAHLAANALQNRPPLGFFRNFVLVADGDHANTLNLKHRGIIPITDLARVYALSAGLPEVNTLERLRAAAEASALSEEGAANLEDAWEFIATLRARHQAQQIKAGLPPDNYIPPDELSKMERSHLKDAFSVISTMQEALGQRYQSARFF